MAKVGIIASNCSCAAEDGVLPEPTAAQVLLGFLTLGSSSILVAVVGYAAAEAARPTDAASQLFDWVFMRMAWLCSVWLSCGSPPSSWTLEPEQDLAAAVSVTTPPAPAPAVECEELFDAYHGGPASKLQELSGRQWQEGWERMLRHASRRGKRFAAIRAGVRRAAERVVRAEMRLQLQSLLEQGNALDPVQPQPQPQPQPGDGAPLSGARIARRGSVELKPLARHGFLTTVVQCLARALLFSARVRDGIESLEPRNDNDGAGAEEKAEEKAADGAGAGAGAEAVRLDVAPPERDAAVFDALKALFALPSLVAMNPSALLSRLCTLRPSLADRGEQTPGSALGAVLTHVDGDLAKLLMVQKRKRRTCFVCHEEVVEMLQEPMAFPSVPHVLTVTLVPWALRADAPLVQYGVGVPAWSSVRDVLAALQKLTAVPATNCVLACVARGRVRRVLRSHEPVVRIAGQQEHDADLWCFQLPEPTTPRTALAEMVLKRSNVVPLLMPVGAPVQALGLRIGARSLPVASQQAQAQGALAETFFVTNSRDGRWPSSTNRVLHSSVVDVAESAAETHVTDNLLESMAWERWCCSSCGALGTHETQTQIRGCSQYVVLSLHEGPSLVHFPLSGLSLPIEGGVQHGEYELFATINKDDDGRYSAALLDWGTGAWLTARSGSIELLAEAHSPAAQRRKLVTPTAVLLWYRLTGAGTAALGTGTGTGTAAPGGGATLPADSRPLDSYVSDAVGFADPRTGCLTPGSFYQLRNSRDVQRRLLSGSEAIAEGTLAFSAWSLPVLISTMLALDTAKKARCEFGLPPPWPSSQTDTRADQASRLLNTGAAPLLRAGLSTGAMTTMNTIVALRSFAHVPAEARGAPPPLTIFPGRAAQLALTRASHLLLYCLGPLLAAFALLLAVGVAWLLLTDAVEAAPQHPRYWYAVISLLSGAEVLLLGLVASPCDLAPRMTLWGIAAALFDAPRVSVRQRMRNSAAWLRVSSTVLRAGAAASAAAGAAVLALWEPGSPRSVALGAAIIASAPVVAGAADAAVSFVFLQQPLSPAWPAARGYPFTRSGAAATQPGFVCWAKDADGNRPSQGWLIGSCVLAPGYVVVVIAVVLQELARVGAAWAQLVWMTWVVWPMRLVFGELQPSAASADGSDVADSRDSLRVSVFEGCADERRRFDVRACASLHRVVWAATGCRRGKNDIDARWLFVAHRSAVVSVVAAACILEVCAVVAATRHAPLTGLYRLHVCALNVLALLFFSTQSRQSLYDSLIVDVGAPAAAVAVSLRCRAHTTRAAAVFTMRFLALRALYSFVLIGTRVFIV